MLRPELSTLMPCINYCTCHYSDLQWGSWLSNHQQLNCLFNSLFWQQGKPQSSTLLTLCEGNPPVTGGFPTQRVSNVSTLLTLCEGNPPVTGGFPTQRVSNVSTLLTLCEGNPRSPVDSPHKGSVMWKAFPWRHLIMCQIVVLCMGTVVLSFFITDAKCITLSTAIINASNPNDTGPCSWFTGFNGTTFKDNLPCKLKSLYEIIKTK